MRNPTKNPTLTLDVTQYDHYLENSDLTEAEKQEFLQMMWDIICNFVMLGFDVQDVDKTQNIPTTFDQTTLSSTGILKPQTVETTQKKEIVNA